MAREERGQVLFLEVELNEVASNTIPEEITFEDEIERQIYFVRTQSKTRKDEFVYKRIG